MKLRGELAALYRQMHPEGWTVSPTSRGHVRWHHASTGAEVVSSSTAGDRRVIREIRTDLRRAVRRAMERAGDFGSQDVKALERAPPSLTSNRQP